MKTYKIKFKADDLKYDYLVDIEVLGKTQEQAVQLAAERAKDFLCSSRIYQIEKLHKHTFFAKPGVTKISDNTLVRKV